jgi:hypothetical protein
LFAPTVPAYDSGKESALLPRPFPADPDGLTRQAKTGILEIRQGCRR